MASVISTTEHLAEAIPVDSHYGQDTGIHRQNQSIQMAHKKRNLTFNILW